MQRIVSKFGGTSMGDAACMLRSAQVALDKKSQVVVVSATSGTTNDLIALSKAAEAGDEVQVLKLFTQIKEKHFKISSELDSKTDTHENLKILLTELETLIKGVFYLKDCSAKAFDLIQSFGERMSSLLFVEAMSKVCDSKVEIKLLDVRDILKTDSSFGKAKPQIVETKINCQQKIIPFISSNCIFVTQGYIGSSLDGFTTTLGRGGSDYSAALIAEGIDADILEIWTDVAGIATTDPRICKEAVVLSEISFQEASELATFGAKILHPATLLPAIRQNIPVFVGSSFNPELGGTWVKKEVTTHPMIRAMAMRKNQILVTLTTPEMLYAHGFLFQIFKVFNDHKISIDAITTSEISVSVTLDDSTLLNKDLINDLSQFAAVQVEEGLSLISLIGNNINHTPGVAKKIFESISEINVRMICLGASKHNFCFLVSEKDANQSIQNLHQAFIQ